MVTMHSALVDTTMSPASSASPPICCVMVKEAMAVALANTLISPAKPAPYADQKRRRQQQRRHQEQPHQTPRSGLSVPAQAAEPEEICSRNKA